MSTFPNALLFQGQNMDFRKIYAESEFVQQEVREMQPFCSVGLERICKEEIPDDPLKTMFEQPAIFAVSMAKLAEDVPEWKRGDFYGLVLGHSFGECAALCASGVLTSEDGMRVAETRGRFTALANYECPGSMAVVIGPFSMPFIYSVCRESRTDLASINGPDQVVIAGPEQSVEQACRIFESKGLRIFPLSIGGAFHSRIMKKAQEKFRAALQQIPFARPNPRTPLIMNTTSSVEENPEVIKNYLARQLTDPVDFPRITRTLERFGAINFFEIGAKKILTGFIKKIRTK